MHLCGYIPINCHPPPPPFFFYFIFNFFVGGERTALFASFWAIPARTSSMLLLASEKCTVLVLCLSKTSRSSPLIWVCT